MTASCPASHERRMLLVAGKDIKNDGKLVKTWYNVTWTRASTITLGIEVDGKLVKTAWIKHLGTSMNLAFRTPKPKSNKQTKNNRAEKANNPDHQTIRSN